MTAVIDWGVIRDFIIEWYWVPMTLVYVGVIITILSENRNPSKSLAYILVIVFVPVLGLLVYYFFGRKPLFKKRVFKRKQAKDRQKLAQYLEQLKPQMEERLQTLEENIGDMAYPFRYLYNLNQSLVSTGNSVRLLNNGEEKFPLLFEKLQAATTYIHLEYYMLTDDEVGSRLAAILIQKWQDGVEVRVLVDDVGSNQIGSLPEQFQEAGVPFLKVLPVRFNSLANSNYRDHRKIVVIDGHTAFVGGINLDARYWNTGEHTLYWRDTSVCIQGPGVNLLQSQFLLSWQFAGGADDIMDQNRYLKNDTPRQGDAIVAVAASGPQSDAPYIMEAVLLAISQAKKSIKITTPYFIPNEALTSALNIAASSGVDVELIIPARSDSFIVQHASFSFIKPLLQRGVRVYLYEKGFIHAKTVCIDSRLTFVGTANMDIRSFFINFEITAMIHEAKLCRDSEASFDADKKHCQLIILRKWQKRSVLHRGLDSVCRLVSPLL
jgi:cardiolipin synthase